MMIAYYRGVLDEYKEHPTIKMLAEQSRDCDYIIAPIADNRMFQAKLIERCYISDNEREYYKNIRLEDAKLGDNKVKLAKRQYRGKGLYIDEILV